MAMQGYKAPSPTRQDFHAAMDMLEHAMGQEALTSFGMVKKHEKRRTDTVSFPRLKVIGQDAYGAPVIDPSKYATNEGVTPTPTTIDYEEVRVRIRHYAILFKITSDAEIYHDQNIPEDMKTLSGEWAGTMREKIAWGAIRGGTNVLYAGSVLSRSQVASVISLSKLQAATRRMNKARGKMTVKKMGTGPDFGTVHAPAGWYVFGHTDCESDIRALPGFEDVSGYRDASTNPFEIGLVGRFHFILTAELDPFLGAGPAVGATGMKADNATNIDVYPLVITAADAWGTLGLRGMDAISPTYFPAGVKSHSNPSGMFGYVGCDMRTAAFLANNNWAIRLEVAVTDL